MCKKNLATCPQVLLKGKQDIHYGQHEIFSGGKRVFRHSKTVISLTGE